MTRVCEPIAGIFHYRNHYEVRISLALGSADFSLKGLRLAGFRISLQNYFPMYGRCAIFSLLVRVRTRIIFCCLVRPHFVASLLSFPLPCFPSPTLRLPVIYLGYVYLVLTAELIDGGH